jgi:hypothetical protein
LDELLNGFARSSAAIPIPEMRSFGIVKLEPSIEVSLECINRFVERLPERRAEELVKDGSVKPFDKIRLFGAIGLSCVDGRCH